MPDDEALHRLLQRMAAGDRLAVHLFYRRAEPFLRGLARQGLDDALRRRLDSVDVAQSAFRRILSASTKARFEDEARALNWVATIVRNRIRSEARKVRVAKREGPQSAVSEGEPGDRGPSPAESATDADEVEALRRAMDHLDAVDRQAVELRDFLGLEFAEIGRLLGLPSADAARKRHDRGILRLRRRLGAGGAT
jgi:RNA polymerase sigma factor (sigma-70 family)